MREPFEVALIERGADDEMPDAAAADADWRGGDRERLLVRGDERLEGAGRVGVEHQPLVGPGRGVAAGGTQDAAGFVGDADDVGVEQRLDAAELPLERGEPLVVAGQLAPGAELLEGVGQRVALCQHGGLHRGVALPLGLRHRHQPVPGLELLAHPRLDRLPRLVAEQRDDRDQHEHDRREGRDQDAHDEARRTPGTFTVRSRGRERGGHRRAGPSQSGHWYAGGSLWPTSARLQSVRQDRPMKRTRCVGTAP